MEPSFPDLDTRKHKEMQGIPQWTIDLIDIVIVAAHNQKS